MHKYEVRTPEQVVAYLVDCTLATVSSMAMKKSRPKYEFQRQISIAQQGCDWMRDMGIDPKTTRAEDIIGIQTVEEWAKKQIND